MRTRRSSIGLATLSLVVAVAAPTAATAREKPSEVCPAIDAPVTAPRLHVFVDPATGRPRPPTAEELRRLAEERLAARANAPPRVFTVITHANGMKSVDLGDAFLFDLRVVRQPDGTTRLECLPHSQVSGTAPAR